VSLILGAGTAATLAASRLVARVVDSRSLRDD
jgi:hypothetical protein